MTFLGKNMNKAKFARKCLLGACLTSVLGVASAAEPITGTLARITGVAVVSQGAQYVKGHEGMQLKEGDRLMVMDGGSAILSFTDGCQYSLADNEVLTIGATSTCASGAVGSYKIDPYTAVSQDPTVVSNSFQPAAVGASAAAIPGWVIPASVLGTLTILGATLDKGSDDRRDPISP